MIGAIIGDIAGSRFEFHNIKTKDFEFLADDCYFTDDTVMTIAVAKAVSLCAPDRSDLAELTIRCMQEIGRHYPGCGYGGRFIRWFCHACQRLRIRRQVPSGRAGYGGNHRFRDP